MSTCTYYSFTPCCGGEPIVFKTKDASDVVVVFPTVPGVYVYEGLTYCDHLGNCLNNDTAYTLQQIPYVGSCEELESTYVPCPYITDFRDFAGEPKVYADCESAIREVKVKCAQAYQFVSCCTGETSVYTFSDDDGTLIDSGSTYTIIFDPNDFTTTGCYTITKIEVENPNILPVLDPGVILGKVDDCNDATCQLLCDPCLCYKFEFPGGSNFPSVTAITCDFQLVTITINESGEVIIFLNPEVSQLLVGGICLRYYQENTIGFDITETGECDIVYWNASGSEINCPIYYKIINCKDPLEEYCVTNDLSVEFANNEIITIVGQPGKCWRIEQIDQCVSPITIIYTITNGSCEECTLKVDGNFELINCNDLSQIIYTSTDLTVFVGYYISLVEYPDDCWYVKAIVGTIPSDVPVTIKDSFITCNDCSKQYYILEDCNIDDPELPIITGTDLSAYVGQIVTLNSCPEICWIVNETDITADNQIVHVENNYATCELCAPVPPQPEPPVYKYKSVKPGYNTPGCSPEKYEEYMCNFSEAMYRHVMRDAYGIEPCCGDDDIKWQIKKELIQLKAITDPDYNCTISTGCECTTSSPGLSQSNCES